MIESNINKISQYRDKFIKKYTGLSLMPSQKLISNRIIQSVLTSNSDIIPISISRQAGKTAVVCGTSVFLGVNYHKLMSELGLKPTIKFSAVITAPIKEQTNTDFERIKEYLTNVNKDYNIDFKTFNGDTIRFNNSEFYSISCNQGSHPESKTANIIIAEEGHDIDDAKFKNAFVPMLATTNGPIIYVGPAGYRRCEFYNALQRYNPVIIDYEGVIKERRAEYERTHDETLLNYEKHCQTQINNMGYDSDEFKTQYRVIWILNRGQLITEKQLFQLEGDYEKGINKRLKRTVASVDWGKVEDSTVITIMNEDYEIIDWLEIQGDDYDKQIEDIVNFFIKYKPVKCYCDATSTQDAIVSWLKTKLTEARISCTVKGISFTSVEKDNMFKLMNHVMLPAVDEKGGITRKGVLRYPKTDCLERRRFLNQTLEIEKEEKNNIIHWGHPDKSGAHDDYVASLALCLYAVRDINKSFVVGLNYGKKTETEII